MNKHKGLVSGRTSTHSMLCGLDGGGELGFNVSVTHTDNKLRHKILKAIRLAVLTTLCDMEVG